MYSFRLLQAALPRFAAPQQQSARLFVRCIQAQRSAPGTAAPSLVRKQSGQRKLPPPLSVLGQTPAEFVASHCLDGPVLSRYAEWQGFEGDLRLGVFTLSECDNVKAAVKLAMAALGIASQDIVGPDSKNLADLGVDLPTFWTTVARSVPMRSQKGVRHHVQQYLFPAAINGAWTPEEDTHLLALKDADGSGLWGGIAGALGRSTGSCSTRWRQLQASKASTNSGKWSDEEDSHLRSAMKEMDGISGGRRPPNFWDKVAEKVRTRSSMSCSDRNHYLNRNHHLTPAYYRCLIEEVAAQKCSRAEDVDWEAITIPFPVQGSHRKKLQPTPRSLHTFWNKFALDASAAGIEDHAGHIVWLREKWKAGLTMAIRMERNAKRAQAHVDAVNRLGDIKVLQVRMPNDQ
ncbi:hypothetical protein P7C70_g4728, partial [Phenoliferia sp. Uapishka_3]